MTGRIMAWAAGVLLALLYGYLVVASVGNILGLQQSADAFGLALTPLAWAVLVFGIALPAIVFVGALLVSRRRTPGTRILVIVAGVCLVAAVQLESNHFVSTYPTAFFA